jgi:hypothetical protein
LLQLRVVFAHGPRQLDSAGDYQVRLRLDLIEHLRPERRAVFRGGRRRNQSRVHHLHQVVVNQVLVRCLDHDRFLASFLQLLVHLLQICVIDCQRIDVDLFCPQVGQRGNRSKLRPGYDDLGDVGLDRSREGNSLFAFGRHHGAVGDQVSQSLRKRGLNLVSSRRKECDFHLQLAGLQLLVGEFLELFQRLVHHSSGLPFVVEKTDRVDQDQSANIAALHRLIQVASAASETHRQRDVTRWSRWFVWRRYWRNRASLRLRLSLLGSGRSRSRLATATQRHQAREQEGQHEMLAKRSRDSGH